MTFLLLSILCSTAIVLLFKSLGVWQIKVFPTICLNYLVCVLCAWAVEGAFPLQVSDIDQPWFPYALFLGVVFITGFNITAMTVQFFSVTVAAVMQKMSLVLTVIYTILFFDERVNTLKIIGISLAILAILFINFPNRKKDGLIRPRKWYLYLFPAYTLLSSALIEIIFFRIEKMTSNGADLGFIALIFGIAGIIGNIILLFGLLSRKIVFGGKEILAGAFLGVINFGSIYFLLKTIGIGWEGSVIFPVNNVSIISLSTIIAIFVFRERLRKINAIGLLAALLSIVLIALS
ncbi:MAG TPA: EamA family transporter [Saprospiraceae bacterium]|nr:EamA family transporter [Saprospiraceae bacterium]